MGEPVHDKEVLPLKPTVSKGMIAAFFLFMVIGCLWAMPCLCMEGAVKGRYKSIFYIIVIIRLSYGLLRRKLSWADYLLWVGMFIIFCVLAESL